MTATPVPIGIKPPADRLNKKKGEPISFSGSIRSSWREWNELGLTPQRLLTILNQARRGDADQLLDLAERMLERDGHMRSVLQTRYRAIDKVPTAVVAVSKDPADQKIADFVQSELIDKPEFRRLRSSLNDAIYKGYSVAEIIWDTSDPKIWRPHYEWRWPQFFAWDRETGTKLQLKTKQEPIDGEPLEPFKWICHAPESKQGLVVRRGLVWPLSMIQLFKSLDARYWMALAEVHGMPWRVGKAKTGATEEDKEIALQTLVDLGHDAAVILPEGIELDIMEAKQVSGTSDFHERIIRWSNQEMSKVVLGQTMTTEDGSSLAQASVHDDVREDIRDADLVDLDDTLTAQLVAAFVRFNVDENLDDSEIPQLQSVSKKAEDAKAAADALKSLFEARGQTVPRVPVWQVMAKMGYSAPEKGDLLLDGTVFDPNAPEPEPAAPPEPSTPAEDPDDEDD